MLTEDFSKNYPNISTFEVLEVIPYYMGIFESLLSAYNVGEESWVTLQKVVDAKKDVENACAQLGLSLKWEEDFSKKWETCGLSSKFKGFFPEISQLS